MLGKPTVCRVFTKKPLDVVHRYMNKYLCKTVSVQCVNTLNYYARKIKLHTMLWNVCSVIIVTPAGRVEKQEQKKRSEGVCAKSFMIIDNKSYHLTTNLLIF